MTDPKKKVIPGLILLALALTALSAQETQNLRRYALFVGANNGGSDRVTLRYAATDAEAMAATMEAIGGVSPSDRLILLDPDPSALTRGFQALQNRISAQRDTAKRVEFLVYYSGHSDETGLLLQGDTYGYRELKDAIHAIPADVHIAILDSCSSGSFTRLKGGERQHPFLLDESVDTSGYAFLTSSSENEAAQESDAIEGSFFTHYLLTGLMGAADHTRNGKVSLNEAYSYASEQTLARTENTLAGPQHPSYDMKLSGSGDLILTDLRASSAGLVIQADVAGRLFIRDNVGKLIAEINKTNNEPLSVALPEGRYSITLERSGSFEKTEISLGRNQTRDLSSGAFVAQRREYARVRGNDQPDFDDTGYAEPSIPLEYVDYDIALFTVNGSNRVVNRLAAGLITSHHTVNGIQISYLMGDLEGDLQGIQLAGVGSSLGGTGQGFQISGVFNSAHSSPGGQIAGVFNSSETDMQGIQISGVFNSAEGKVDGFQSAGVFNSAEGDLNGFQMSGVFNSAEGSVAGMQLAGVFNWAEGTVSGIQGAGVFNVAGDLPGVQIGVVNVARDVTGPQIGLINISRSNRGLPIGLINISADGATGVTSWSDSRGFTYAGFQFGTRNSYTLLSAGTSIHDPWAVYSAGVSLGLHLPLGQFYLESDLGHRVVFTREDTRNPEGWVYEDNSYYSARFLGGIRLIGNLSLMGGVQLDGWFPRWMSGTGYPLYEGEKVEEFSVEDFSIRYVPRWFIGLRL